MTSEWFMNYLCHPCNPCVTIVVTYNTFHGMRCMMYDIFVFESNLRFRPSTRKKILKPAFSKNSFMGTGFENLHFWCPKKLYTCGLKSAE